MIKELTENNFKQETANGVCVIDFWATWCGPCRMMSPVIEGLSEKRPDLKFYKVNVDEQPQLAARFGITSIPTMLFFRSGALTGRMVGARETQDLREALGL